MTTSEIQDELQHMQAELETIMATQAPDLWQSFKEAWEGFTKVRDTGLMPMARSGDFSSYQKVYDSDAVPVLIHVEPAQRNRLMFGGGVQ